MEIQHILALLVAQVSLKIPLRPIRITYVKVKKLYYRYAHRPPLVPVRSLRLHSGWR